MARYTGPVCRLCRREGQKLFLKGARCWTEKCAVTHRESPPGEHTRYPRKQTEYGIRLREKQKLRRMYGMMEKQFAYMFKRAAKKRGATGDNLLLMLESRLDNVVFRSGFGRSRSEARQLVQHGHLNVNGRRVDVPSYEVKPGDQLAVRKGSLELGVFRESVEFAKQHEVPAWLEVEPEALRSIVKRAATREEIAAPVEVKLVVELYSR